MCCRETHPDRRQFLTQITGTAITLAAAAALTSSAEGCGDAASVSSAGGTLSVDVSGLTQDGQSLVSNNGPEGAPVLVVRQSASEYEAFWMVCTHQGCILDNPSSNGVMFCPCHGSEFNSQGAVLRGPASQALTRFTTAFDATTGKITVTF
jgi:Rieske Fe-S protein